MPLEPIEGGDRRTASPPPAAGATARAGGLSELLARVARPEPPEPGALAPPARPGQVIGRFELLRELGRGGFGVVFEARDRELGRLVAFKAVRPGTRARSAQREEWLRREAEATAQLSHPSIVSLFDAGQGAAGPYLVFELLEGETLAERLARGPLPPGEAVRVAAAIARALAYAHAAGVLHRDLKPSNVFLTEQGEVKVLDFGLAHVFGWSGARSGGTAPYMAPEQWRGEPEDGRTDLFALGVLLHEMLTGRLPYELRDGRSAALDARQPPPPPEGIPAPLRALLASALSPAASGRPPGAAALLERLIEAERALAAPRRDRWRRRAIFAAVGVAVLAAAAAAWRLSASRRQGALAAGAAAPVPAPSPAARDSVDAYRHYFAAMKSLETLRYGEANAELERALEIDPEFALAHYYRAYLGEFAGAPPAVRRVSAEAAARYADRLPEKEQLLVRAWAAHARGDDALAGRIYDDAVARNPADAEVLYFAGDLHFHADDWRRAIPYLRRSLAARPGWAPPLAHLLEALESVGDHAAVVSAARAAVAAAPNPDTYAALGAALLLDQPDEAIRALRSGVAAGGGPLATRRLSIGLLLAGRPDESEVEARRLMAPELPAEWQLEGHHQVVVIRLFQRRGREAVRALDAIPATLRAANVGHQHEVAAMVLANLGGDPGRLWLEARSWGSAIAALPLAYAGDLAHAAEVAPGLLGGGPRQIYEGLVAWRRGDRTAAIARFEAAGRAIGVGIAWVHLAGVLSELGRDREALEALDALRVVSLEESPLPFAYPRALLLRARSLERLGRRAEARAQVEALLRLWRDADPDSPELAEARAIGARVAARVASGSASGPAPRDR